MSVTMKRVAADLGVSVTTVSKVLNNHADIGPSTRARVLAKVRELGYRPNAVARSLTLRRTHTLGVILPDLMHSFFVEIVSAIEAVSSARGYALLLCNSGENVQRERSQIEVLRQRQVDGLLLASAHTTGNADLLRKVTALRTGLVMIDRDDHPRIRCHRVLTDDERVGYLATSHLITLGRKGIVHLAGPSLMHARRRERGYRQAMKEHGLTVSSESVISTGFMETQGYETMKRLLTEMPTVDAVFAVNDPGAIGAMKAIWSAGRRVPDDIAVIGAGDIAHGDMLRVPLTTVSWSREEMGRQAAELLLDQIELHPSGPFQRIVLPPRLLIRGSCGATSIAEALATQSEAPAPAAPPPVAPAVSAPLVSAAARRAR
jgi:LacI family transcriptional regulator, galactose operon repressor